MTFTRLPLPLLALLALTASAPADDAGDALARAFDLRAGGRYGDALGVLDSAPAGPARAAARAEVLLETGKIEEAGAAAGEGGDDPRCRTLLGESLLLRGRLDEAAAAVEAALAAAPDLERARYLAGRIALERGDRDAARAAFGWFFTHYSENAVTDPEALTFVALASMRLAELQPDAAMDFQVTLNLLDDVTKKHPDYLPAFVAKAELFLACYGDMLAKKWADLALRKNPRLPSALYVLAEQSSFRFNEFEGVRKCEEALLTNPNLFEAREFVARVRLGDSLYEEAAAELEKVLAVNPRRKQARGLLAARDYLLGDRAGFERRMAEVLAEDPRWAGGYVDLVGILEQQRRFGEAAEWGKRATEVDPEDWRAWWVLGRNLVHLAREGPAREALVASRRLDPYAHFDGNPFRENMIEVLAHLEEFVETRTENFVFKAHVGENAVLSRYYHRFLERSWTALTKKYGFTPEGPILTEIFHLHEDFAARTIGLPGIGALGACFGRVITLDSPSARNPGEFVWASTAHHEFAHVITLQLSKGRVPRWFTEGLSVFEEREYADWWERDLDRALFDRFANDALYPIEKFNGAFRSGDVMFAYYLGGMICEYISGEFGFAKIVAMLEAYGEDRQTPEVLKKALGVSPAEFDAGFRAWVGKLVGAWKLTPRWNDETVKKMAVRLEKEPADAEALVVTAWAHFQRGNIVDAMNVLGRALQAAPDDPRLGLLRGEIAFANGRTDQAKKWFEAYLAGGRDDFVCRLRLARILEDEKDSAGAIAQYEAAKACFPRDAGPHRELARLRKGEGDLDGAVRELEGYARLANTDLKVRVELADHYEAKGEWEKLAKILTEVVWIYPLGAESAVPVHARLADALRRTDDPEGAAIEYEVALELGVPRDREPEIRTSLAEVYLLAGRLRDARFQAGAALEVDPTFERAKELLERHPAR